MEKFYIKIVHFIGITFQKQLIQKLLGYIELHSINLLKTKTLFGFQYNSILKTNYNLPIEQTGSREKEN